jgi:hypothetical protein
VVRKSTVRPSRSGEEGGVNEFRLALIVTKNEGGNENFFLLFLPHGLGSKALNYLLFLPKSGLIVRLRCTQQPH